MELVQFALWAALGVTLAVVALGAAIVFLQWVGQHTHPLVSGLLALFLCAFLLALLAGSGAGGC